MQSRTPKRRGRPVAGVVENGRVKGVGAETEALIIDVAIRLFAEEGYDAITMRQIADQADVTPGSIYNHFPDKRALYLAACRISLSRIAEDLIKGASGKSAPREKLEIIVATLAEAMVRDPSAAKLFAREMVASDREGLALLEKDSFEGPFEMLSEILHELTGDADSHALAASVYALVLGLVQFSEFLETGGRPVLRFHQDARALTAHILRLILPS